MGRKCSYSRHHRNTYYTPSSYYKINGYQIFSRDSSLHWRRGTAVLVHNSCHRRNRPISSLTKWRIYRLENPFAVWPDKFLQLVLSTTWRTERKRPTIQPRTIITIDLNARNCIYGDNIINRKGTHLERTLSTLFLSKISSNYPTHFSERGMSIVQGPSPTSDYLPILIYTSLNTLPIKKNHKKRLGCYKRRRN